VDYSIFTLATGELGLYIYQRKITVHLYDNDNVCGIWHEVNVISIKNLLYEFYKLKMTVIWSNFKDIVSTDHISIIK